MKKNIRRKEKVLAEVVNKQCGRGLKWRLSSPKQWSGHLGSTLDENFLLIDGREGFEVGTPLIDYLGLDLDVVGRLLELEVPFALGNLSVVQKPENKSFNGHSPISLKFNFTKNQFPFYRMPRRTMP